MDAPEQLVEKAAEYTTLSAWHDERAMARGEYAEAHAGAALGFALVAIASVRWRLLLERTSE